MKARKVNVWAHKSYIVKAECSPGQKVGQCGEKEGVGCLRWGRGRYGVKR